jgi:hypothetical protein
MANEMTTREREIYRLGHRDGVITHMETWDGDGHHLEGWKEHYNEGVEKALAMGLDLPKEITERWR